MGAVEGGVVLALNSGSSSLKYGLYAVDGDPVLLVGGTIETTDDHGRFFDAIERVPRLRDRVPRETARYWTTMERHKLYIAEQGDDLPEVRDWQWS